MGFFLDKTHTLERNYKRERGKGREKIRGKAREKDRNNGWDSFWIRHTPWKNTMDVKIGKERGKIK